MIKFTFYPEFRIIQNELNQIFDKFYKIIDKPRLSESAWVPLADLYENEDHLVFKIEIPGVEHQNIKIEIRSNYLFIEGIKYQTREHSDVRFILVERLFGKFSRYLPINTSIDTNTAKATLKNGILIVSFKKITEKRESIKKIPIEKLSDDGEKRIK